MEQQLNNPGSNLAVRVLSVVGGLLAALCLIGFLILSDIARSEVALLVVGICAIGASVVGNRIIHQLFLDTSIITFYVAGCVALLAGMTVAHWNTYLICVVFMLIAVATFFLSRGVFFSTLAVLLFNTAFTGLVMNGADAIESTLFVVLLMGIVFFLLNTFEARIVAGYSVMRRLFRALHAGFFLSFAVGVVWMSGIGYVFNNSVSILSVVTWVGIVLMLRKIMKTMDVQSIRTKVWVYVVCAALLVPTVFAPYLSGALLLLLLCFGYGYNVETVASLLLVMYVIVKYYYDLQLTLLTKSGILVLTGIVLLLTYYYFTKKKNDHEEI